jgi:hypothetical protein
MTKDNPRTILRRILRDISPPHDEDYKLALNYLPSAAERLPLPYMVFLTLLLGTECKYISRPMEKTAWSIYLRFKNVPFCLEHGKFGMRIATPATKDVLMEELVSVLHRAFPIVDEVLQQDVNLQVRTGNVTIPNEQYLLRKRYEFFRDSARAAFDAPQPKLESLFRQTGSEQEGSRSFDILKNEREGFFFGTAAIDSYFSWLEHVLILILPFVGYDPIRNNLLVYISSSWTDKIKKIWDVSGGREEKSMYDALRKIKERFRNSITHGCLEKGAGSLRVHIPGIGVVPARLSRFTKSIHYDMFPLKEASFNEACELFDAVDAHLHSNSAKYGMKFAEAGFNVAFDAKSREDYRSAMNSDCDFDKLLERISYVVDKNTNMDW